MFKLQINNDIYPILVFDIEGTLKGKPISIPAFAVPKEIKPIMAHIKAAGDNSISSCGHLSTWLDPNGEFSPEFYCYPDLPTLLEVASQTPGQIYYGKEKEPWKLFEILPSKIPRFSIN